MARERRLLRLQQLVLETIAQTVQREVRDPRVGLVSITRVELARDLSRARVWWSCLETESARRTCARGIEDAAPLLQRAVARAMQTRVTPKLQLAFDETLEKAERLESIFTRLREERGEPPEGEGDEGEESEDVEGLDEADPSQEDAPEPGEPRERADHPDEAGPA